MTSEVRAERRKSVGGSEVSTLLGINPYSTPLDLYNSKIEDVNFNNIACRRGHMLEPLVVQLFEEETGYAVIGENDAVLRSEQYPYIHATVDRLVVIRDGKWSVLEAKTAVGHGTKAWIHGCPEHYKMQLISNTGVVKYFRPDWEMNAHSYIAALIDDEYYQEFVWYDDALFKTMHLLAEDMMVNHVAKLRPPSLETVKDWVRFANVSIADKVYEADQMMLESLVAFKSLEAEMKGVESSIHGETLKIKELKSQMEDIKTQTKLNLDDEGVIKFNNIIIATCKHNRTKTKFSAEEFRKEHPDLYRKYCISVPGARPLLVRKNVEQLYQGENHG